MSWLDDFMGKLGGGIIDLLPIIGGYGLQQSGWGSAKRPLNGYQGGVPEYDIVRERVPGTNDPDRRPGSSGQRYFTQTQYVPKGEGTRKPKTAQELAAENAANPAREERRPEDSLKPNTERPNTDLPSIGIQPLAGGGIAQLARGRYLSGNSDGMADKIPARIDGQQEARLSDGEFVIPADVVSHLGNGNSEAGAKKLKQMMARVREARTGNDKQGKQIDPNKLLPV